MKSTIKCVCGESVNIKENQIYVRCENCKREYQKKPPTLSLLGIEKDEGLTGNAAVII